MQITDEEFIDIVKNVYTIAEILRNMELVPAGGNYRIVKKRIKDLNLDTSHFKGRGWLKGKKHNNYRPSKRALSDILLENSYYNSNRLKRRLLEEKYFERKCYNCNLTKWLNGEIPLELEHKNGINNDNRIENLTLLCPNCHALTPNYRGRNLLNKVNSKKYDLK